MSEDILRIIKQHDDWKNSVEVKENAKGEPAITVKTRSDENLKDLVDEALKQYKYAKQEVVKQNG